MQPHLQWDGEKTSLLNDTKECNRKDQLFLLFFYIGEIIFNDKDIFWSEL